MAHLEMWWLIWICDGSFGDVVAHWFVHQNSGAKGPDSNPASPTMILMHCRIFVIMYVENLRVEGETYP